MDSSNQFNNNPYNIPNSNYQNGSTPNINNYMAPDINNYRAPESKYSVPNTNYNAPNSQYSNPDIQYKYGNNNPDFGQPTQINTGNSMGNMYNTTFNGQKKPKNKKKVIIIILIIILVLGCCCCGIPTLFFGLFKNTLQSELSETINYEYSSINENLIPYDWESSDTNEEAKMMEDIMGFMGIPCKAWTNTNNDCIVCVTGSLDEDNSYNIDFFSEDEVYVAEEYLTTNNGNVWFCGTQEDEEGLYDYECYAFNTNGQYTVVEMVFFQDAILTNEEIVEFLNSYDETLDIY